MGSSGSKNQVQSLWSHLDKKEELGSGGYGNVYKVNAKNTRTIARETTMMKGDVAAVKVIDKYQDATPKKVIKSDVGKEVEVLSKVAKGNSPYIVKFFGSLKDRKHYSILTELCTGGELMAYIDNLGDDVEFGELQVSRILNEILMGIAHCHNEGVAHMDCKPENICLTSPSLSTGIKIIDFGCSKVAFDAAGIPLEYTDFAGTLDFAAPEMLFRYPRISGSGLFACDMWAIGILTYLLTTGHVPFRDLYSKDDRTKANTIRRKILAGDYEFTNPIRSHALEDFISKLLVLDPKLRMTVEEALQHPWIAEPEVVASSASFDPMVKEGLKNFKGQPGLVKFAASLLLSNLSSKDHSCINRIFNKYDVDSNGTLEFEELVLVFQEAFGRKGSDVEDEVRNIVAEFDLDSDGVISYNEFAELFLRGSLALDPSRVRKAFLLLDDNNDGVISRDEFYSHAQSTMSLSHEDIIKLILEVDSNADGFISMDEFISAMGHNST